MIYSSGKKPLSLNKKQEKITERIRDFFVTQKCVPWRLSNAYKSWLENSLRFHFHKGYMLLKYGRLNINTKQYWNDIWGGNDPVENRNYRELFDQIVQIVPDRTRVLDVGCGSGILLKRLMVEKECEPVGVDISDKAIESLRQMGIEGAVSKLPKIPYPDNSFDVVIGTEILEHLAKPKKTIKQMARVIKSDGLIIVSSPENSLPPEDEAEHLNVMSERDLKTLLEPYIGIAGVRKGTYGESNRERFLLLYGFKSK